MAYVDEHKDRLRDALAQRGLGAVIVGERLGVDPKTAAVGEPVTSAIPQASGAVECAAPRAGKLAVAGRRVDRAAEVGVSIRGGGGPPPPGIHSGDDWLRLFSSATTFVDILVYAGLFLPEQSPTIIDGIKHNAAGGARVRLLLGDPDCRAVHLRGEEEGIGSDAVATKVSNSLRLLRRSLHRAPGVQLRLHCSTLYTSIYRSDDTMIANPHVLGLPAAQARAIHLRRLTAGGVVRHVRVDVRQGVGRGSARLDVGRRRGAHRVLR